MPAYNYQCPNCGAVKTDMRKIEERHDGPRCHQGCRFKMKLLVSPVVGIVKNPAVPKGSK